MCRHRTWHTSRTRVLALTHSMNKHGRAAAMVTPIGDKKTLLPAESAVSSSGCAGRGGVKRAARERRNGSTRLQGAQRREGVCVGLGCRGPECDFQYFPTYCPRDCDTNGDGAPPQAHIHLNLEDNTSGSPPTKFGYFVTACNRRQALFTKTPDTLWEPDPGDE